MRSASGFSLGLAEIALYTRGLPPEEASRSRRRLVLGVLRWSFPGLLLGGLLAYLIGPETTGKGGRGLVVVGGAVMLAMMGAMQALNRWMIAQSRDPRVQIPDSMLTPTQLYSLGPALGAIGVIGSLCLGLDKSFEQAMTSFVIGMGGLFIGVMVAAVVQWIRR